MVYSRYSSREGGNFEVVQKLAPGLKYTVNLADLLLLVRCCYWLLDLRPFSSAGKSSSSLILTSMFTQSSQWLTIMGYKKFPTKPHRFLKSIVIALKEKLNGLDYS